MSQSWQTTYKSDGKQEKTSKLHHSRIQRGKITWSVASSSSGQKREVPFEVEKWSKLESDLPKKSTSKGILGMMFVLLNQRVESSLEVQTNQQN